MECKRYSNLPISPSLSLFWVLHRGRGSRQRKITFDMGSGAKSVDFRTAPGYFQHDNSPKRLRSSENQMREVTLACCLGTITFYTMKRVKGNLYQLYFQNYTSNEFLGTCPEHYGLSRRRLEHFMTYVL